MSHKMREKGHRFLMGVMIVVVSLTCAGVGGAFGQNISRDPTDFAPYGGPLGRTTPATVDIDFWAHERTGTLDVGPDGDVDTGDDVRYCYYTFGHSADVTTGKVPGPFIRVLEGDTINFTLHNPVANAVTHSIDLHAVKGFKGGASVLMAAPGADASLTFQVLQPGLYVYHCAGDGTVLMIGAHISLGMWGMILVEPRKGGYNFRLDKKRVDKEYYIMQSEFYLSGFDPLAPVPGTYCLDIAKLVSDEPDYVVFNGRAGVERTTLSPIVDGNVVSPVVITPDVFDDVIIYFGNMGPNLTSATHMIGDIWDREYTGGDVLSPPHLNVETSNVPCAENTIWAFKPLVTAAAAGGVPGGINVFLDHCISHVAKGALGVMIVQ
ncbi:MAG: multicopper oxidase domain-containing protein [Planctomycetes bacterium]|nr:multicopper oxidase domain-containing protein [Planctomycetota bacterium]